MYLYISNSLKKLKSFAFRVSVCLSRFPRKVKKDNINNNFEVSKFWGRNNFKTGYRVRKSVMAVKKKQQQFNRRTLTGRLSLTPDLIYDDAINDVIRKPPSWRHWFTSSLTIFTLLLSLRSVQSTRGCLRFKRLLL